MVRPAALAMCIQVCLWFFQKRRQNNLGKNRNEKNPPENKIQIIRKREMGKMYPLSTANEEIQSPCVVNCMKQTRIIGKELKETRREK